MMQILELTVVVLALVAALLYLGRKVIRKFRSPLCSDGCGCASKLLKHK